MTNTDKQAAYDKIALLVETFGQQIETFKKTLNETETRILFINPFFEALGWDMDNSKLRLPMSYKDVIHEDKVTIDGRAKAPDYCFTNYGKRVFYLEAKKPSIQIKTDPNPAYQLRRYGWSSKMPISVLTDFEEFALYDCAKQPKQEDVASVGRLKYLTYDRYLAEFDWLWEVFAKENVLKGSLDRFAKPDKKGTQSVDASFLTSLDGWRQLLAGNIAVRNKGLGEDETNFVVQMNINRIVFLRNCEDRGLETYGKLKNCLVNSKKEGAYFSNIYQLFREADIKYNSGLFDFSKDTLSDSVSIDNKTIAAFVGELYYPKSPFEFSVIGAEILGAAYERFLGKVIRLTAGHQAKVEEKPEVRKAGGVFYTPQYIVGYIVKNTVGKLIAEKTPEEIAKIKICDPACGSGSFLLGAYQCLLSYHADWYETHYKKSRNLKDSPLTPDGKLTTHAKKQILLNNIFGADLDAQAVEVTKLSLLMKCMEGETSASMQTALTFERVLPTLDDNIKSGNSLIDFDFYENSLDFKGEKKIKPFNWKQSFPAVFKQGGFDALIGNPPYVRSKLLDEEERGYFSNKFDVATGTYDLYALFIEKAFSLAKEGGFIAYINPNKYFYSDYGAGLRDFIGKKYDISSIVDFNEFQVFEGITTYTTVNIFLKSEKKQNFIYNVVSDRKIPQKKIESFLMEGTPDQSVLSVTIEPENLASGNWIFKQADEVSFIGRIKDASKPLIEMCYKIYQGFVLTPTEVFPVSIEKENEGFYEIKPIKEDETIYEAEKDLLIPIIKSSAIFRYHIVKKNYHSVFPYRYNDNGTAALIPEKTLKEKYPKGYKYLKAKAEYLKTREKGKWAKSPNWYEYSRKQNFECQKMSKILVPGLATEARYTLADGESFIDQGSYGIILNETNKIHEKFVLGLLNSKLMDFIFKAGAGTLSGGYFSYQTKYLRDLPIKLPANDAEKKIYAKIVTDVDSLIKLTKELQEENKEAAKKTILGRIAYTEQHINDAVYELYGLSPNEIRFVERK